MSAPSYTVSGSPEVETKIDAIVAEVSATISREVEASRYRALVLIGGYGRGEGGVEFRDGEEHPHNNLDFLLITRNAGLSRGALERDRLSLALEPLRIRHDVGIDIGVVSEATLRTSPCLVMWNDMRFGHRTLLGDSRFVPSLTRFSVDRIPGWDIRNLLVNVLLEAGTWSTRTARTVIRHAMKAIIGYGDALLYFNGRYHWSYVEKQDRMRSLVAAPGVFRRLYDMAIDFRFNPNYGRYLDCYLPRWLDDLNAVLADIHLTCERARLGDPTLQWEHYLDTALRRFLREDLASPRSLGKKITNAARRPVANLDVSALATLGTRAAGPRTLLPILFPAVAYRSVAPAFCKALRDFGDGPSARRRRYLELWGEHVDINFAFPDHGSASTADSTRAAA
jgi:hypothetical protein